MGVTKKTTQTVPTFPIGWDGGAYDSNAEFHDRLEEVLVNVLNDENGPGMIFQDANGKFWSFALTVEAHIVEEVDYDGQPMSKPLSERLREYDR